MLLGLQPLDQNILLYEVILTSVKEQSLALIVPKIFGITKISGDRIDNNTMSIPSVMRPHIKGYVQEQGELFYLLQAESILSSAILHS
jgi:twitching motility protein PilI